MESPTRPRMAAIHTARAVRSPQYWQSKWTTSTIVDCRGCKRTRSAFFASLPHSVTHVSHFRSKTGRCLFGAFPRISEQVREGTGDRRGVRGEGGGCEDQQEARTETTGHAGIGCVTSKASIASLHMTTFKTCLFRIHLFYNNARAAAYVERVKHYMLIKKILAKIKTMSRPGWKNNKKKSGRSEMFVRLRFS